MRPVKAFESRDGRLWRSEGDCVMADKEYEAEVIVEKLLAAGFSLDISRLIADERYIIGKILEGE